MSALSLAEAATPQPSPSSLDLARRLRKRRLGLERGHVPSGGPPTRPDIYFDHAPCGTYPIIALRSVPCDLYIKGYCGPCSYSARAYPVGLSQQALYASLLTQIEWVLSHFDELFVKRSSGRLDGYRLRPAPARPWYMLQLAGESSFFRDAEVPPAYRRAILERLVSFQERHGINLHLMLECRAEHLLAADRSGELCELGPLFRALDVVVNMGFEYRDDYLRNTFFAKSLDLEALEAGVEAAKTHRLDPGIFIFAGGHILTVREVLEETERTLRYLEELDVFCNVMVPNLQSYTVPDLLWEFGEYELPDPYFLLDVAELVLRFRPTRPNRVTPFDWFIGGLESDPPPRVTLLNNPRRATPYHTTQEIHACLLDLVRTLDKTRFRRDRGILRARPEHQPYEVSRKRSDGRPWAERLATATQFAWRHLPTYDAHMSGRDGREKHGFAS